MKKKAKDGLTKNQRRKAEYQSLRGEQDKEARNRQLQDALAEGKDNITSTGSRYKYDTTTDEGHKIKKVGIKPVELVVPPSLPVMTAKQKRRSVR